ncbi:MAG TPA: CaiB/BaiF CoA-transferase family protein [Thermoanaerobaculia bacterium]|nr:CaiB/BaiF CoA-transferase family protein [Thermoanaerobaculia bacterium]
MTEPTQFPTRSPVPPPTPLAGILVADLTRHLPGPLAARLLADLGARVVKVEEPAAGDPVRAAQPLVRGISPLAGMLLAGVESVALDLKQPAGRDVADRLIARADVLLESFRPGRLARFGWAPEELKRRFPRLIVCSISGWGQDGPDAHRAGHDLAYQAAAGLLAPTAEMPAAPLADLMGAWSAVSAVLAALYERERTGRGTHVDAALYDAGLHANLIGWAAEAAGEKKIGEPLGLTGELPCYRLYESADGKPVALALLEPWFWHRFCHAAERPELSGLQYRKGLGARRKVERLIRQRTRSEWAEFFAAHDLPAGPVLSAAEARASAQAKARGVVSETEDGLPRLAFPARFDGRRPASAPHLPGLGDSTSGLLDELGAPEARLTRFKLRASGIGAKWSWKKALRRLVRRA